MRANGSRFVILIASFVLCKYYQKVTFSNYHRGTKSSPAPKAVPQSLCTIYLLFKSAVSCLILKGQKWPVCSDPTRAGFALDSSACPLHIKAASSGWKLLGLGSIPGAELASVPQAFCVKDGAVVFEDPTSPYFL